MGVIGSCSAEVWNSVNTGSWGTGWPSINPCYRVNSVCSKAFFSTLLSWLILTKRARLTAHLCTVPRRCTWILFSELQDQDVVKVAKQSHSISKRMHHKLDCSARYRKHITEMQPRLISNASLKISKKDKIKLKPSPTSLNEQIFYTMLLWQCNNYSISVCLSMWGCGKIMCECEMVFFGTGLNAWLWENQAYLWWMWRFLCLAQVCLLWLITQHQPTAQM